MCIRVLLQEPVLFIGNGNDLALGDVVCSDRVKSHVQIGAKVDRPTEDTTATDAEKPAAAEGEDGWQA